MIATQDENHRQCPAANRRAGRFAGCVLIVSCLAGCSQGAAEGPGAAAPPPPPMKVSYPVESRVTDYADFTGRTMAVESVKLRARVWGHLEKINFTEGADVKQGAVLFIIDQRPYKAALARADAEVAQSEARYKRLLGDKKRADALVLSKAISIEDFEKIVGDLSEAAAMVKSAAATREVAKLNLDFTEVKSPISGQISRAMVTVGNMVASGETGGTVLTTIMSTDPMYAYFDVDDQTWVRIREQLRKSNLGLPAVQLGLSNEKGFPHVGKLDFIDNEVDAGTGTLRDARPLPKQGPHAHSRPVRARSAPSGRIAPRPARHRSRHRHRSGTEDPLRRQSQQQHGRETRGHAGPIA